jgi:hypothetical protein
LETDAVCAGGLPPAETPEKLNAPGDKPIFGCGATTKVTVTLCGLLEATADATAIVAV